MFARLLKPKKLSQILMADNNARSNSATPSTERKHSDLTSIPAIANPGILAEPSIRMRNWMNEQRVQMTELFLLPPYHSASQWISVAPKQQLKRADNAYQQQLNDLLTPEERQQRLARRKKNDRMVKAAGISLALATVSQFYSPLKLLCLPFLAYATVHWYQKAYQLAKKGEVGVPTLYAITITGAVVNGLVWAPSLAALVAQASLKLTNIVTEDTLQKMIDIFRQAPKSAWVVIDGTEIQMPLDQVRIGHTVIVNAGEVVPVDGKIISGVGLIDERLLTGESRPVEKMNGDAVFAGTVLLSGRVEIVVEKAGEQTAVAQIGQILNNTVDYKSTSQLRAEALSQRTVLPTLVAGAVAVPVLGPMGALAVVDAHFRQRLSFLSPLALINYLNIASRHGVLIKDGRSLDLLHQVDTIVFDKTGTLTEEQPSVVNIHPFADLNEDRVLYYAAAAEQKQTHPVALAILAMSEQRLMELPELEEAEYKVGFGLTGKVENHQILVGSKRFVATSGCSIPPALHELEERIEGHSLILVARDGVLIGAIELMPTIRHGAKQVIRELKERHGITATYIISGDQEAPTRQLARQLDIDHYFSETLPEQKADFIESLIQQGRFVCYVGDGINDAIALKKAHVSISLTGASSVAIDTAQIILVEGKLPSLSYLFEYAHGFRRNTDRSFGIVLSSTLTGIFGAFFLHFTIAQTTILAAASLIGGVGNSLLPLLWRPSSSAEQEPTPLKI